MCLFPLSAGAQNLRGQWDVETLNETLKNKGSVILGRYLSSVDGVILIDASGRVTWDITHHL